MAVLLSGLCLLDSKLAAIPPAVPFHVVLQLLSQLVKAP